MPDEKAAPARFPHATARLMIGTVHYLPKNIEVDAQYNPKELQLERSVPWTQHNMANGGGTDAGDPREIYVEFTGAQGRTMTLELLFDGYEQGTSIADTVAKLERMATVRDPTSSKEEDRRPPLCVVTWGDRGVPRFQCVIEQLAIKYTMFHRNGTPLRAVCTVKLREATKLFIPGPADSREPRGATARSRSGSAAPRGSGRG